MIEIKNFSFKYKNTDVKILDNINLNIEDGEFLGIIGASGAGKTTLSCAINGVIPHHFKGNYYGKIIVNQKDVFETEPCNLALDVGSVFQDVESQLTSSIVEDEILFGLENFGIPKQQIEERLVMSLQETGIENLRYREINSLSGGQKQKVAIASIIALRPKILVLDEPTGELDPCASRNIFNLLTKLNKDFGITLIVIEQKVMLLCEYVNKLAVMDKGKIVNYGEVRDVLKNSDELLKIGINCPRVVTYCQQLTTKENVCINIEEAFQLTKKILGVN